MKKEEAFKQKHATLLHFWFKVCALVLLVILLDLSIGSILKYYYYRQTSGFLYRTTSAIDKTTADVLIFGTSKANHQYHPEVFEKRLNLSYYNVGRDGSSIFYHYAILRAVLKRYTPKMIILDMSRELIKKPDSYDRISMLLPYYYEHPEMRPLIELKSPLEKFKLLSAIYPYNSLLFSIIAGNSRFNKERFKDLEGYLPLDRIWNESLKTFPASINNELDSTKIKTYTSFIQACIRSGTKLYIIDSPHFYKLLSKDKSDVLSKKIAQEYNITYFDYSDDSLFINNARYFADIHHLNNSGSIVFSNHLLDDMVKDTKFKSINKAQLDILHQ